jgi:predicted  nucleic acid-binding Zn-ribbon protein
MRKKLVIMLAGLLTVLSMGFGAAQFSDVPAGHWAQEAVEAITARGIIVGFPDGTFRGNENLTRYQAALIIYRLLQQLEAEKGKGPTTEAVTAMTEEEKAALQNAIQELAAELAALGVRVSALEDNAATKDDIATLQAQIDELKAGMAPAQAAVDQQALQDLADRVEAASVAADTALAQAQELGQRIDTVEGDVAALKSEVEANADSISALNELAVLLNQDVLSLQDRVTAVEKALADIQAQPGVDLSQYATLEDVAALQEFASALRTDLVALSEKVSALETAVAGLDKRVATLESNAFTISGSLTLTYQVKRAWALPGSAAGAPQTFDIDRLFTNNFSSGDTNGNDLVVDEEDLGQVQEGTTTAELSVKFSFKDRTAVSDPGKLNTYPDLVNFSFDASLTNPAASSSTALNLTVNKVSTTLKVADGQVLTFTFGRSVKTKFTEYVFDNDVNSRGEGFVATGPFPLGGTTTVVYGSKGGANGDNTYFRAIRAAFGLGPISLGASFAQEGLDQQAGGGAESPARTAYGFDGKASLGPITLSGEYFGTADNIGAPNPALSGTGYYVKADAGLGPITFSGTYRSLSSAITAANMLSGDANFTAGTSDNSAPFAGDQSGFGVNLGATLGIFSLSGYFQNYSYGGTTKAAGNYGAYGGSVKLGLGAITLEGFYRSASLNNVAAASIPNEKPGTDTYTSTLGGKLTAALGVANLTGYFTNNYVANTNTYGAYGDATLDLGVAKVKAIGRYDNSAGTETIKYGAQLSTQPLFFGISLTAEGSSRTTGTTIEGVYAFGVKLGQFLFSNSTFEVKYGAYGGQNLASILVGSTSKAFDASVNEIYSTAGANSGEVRGIYFTWYYWDLVFSYADFDVNQNSVLTHGQAFKITYKVNF